MEISFLSKIIKTFTSLTENKDPRSKHIGRELKDLNFLKATLLLFSMKMMKSNGTTFNTLPSTFHHKTLTKAHSSPSRLTLLTMIKNSPATSPSPKILSCLENKCLSILSTNLKLSLNSLKNLAPISLLEGLIKDLTLDIPFLFQTIT